VRTIFPIFPSSLGIPTVNPVRMLCRAVKPKILIRRAIRYVNNRNTEEVSMSSADKAFFKKAKDASKHWKTTAPM